MGQRPHLIGWVERAPGPPWVVYTVLTTIAIALSNLQGWAAGTVPWGQLDVPLTYYGILTIAPLWLIHGLDRVARSSLDAFWPATGLGETAKAERRHELTIIPARPAILLAAASAFLTLLSYWSDPVGMRIAGLGPPVLVLRAVAEIAIGAFVLVLLYHSLRQLRAVSRIHTLAARIDLLRPAPLFAFFRLTGGTAIGIVLILYSSLLADPEAWTNAGSSILPVPWLVIPTLVSAAAFTLPLRGMQQRIAAEKRRVQDECARRIEDVTASIHAAVDSDDLSRADGLNKMLASLIVERDMLARLPTWPWQPGTMGAFVTAIVLPVGLFLVTRLIERSL